MTSSLKQIIGLLKTFYTGNQRLDRSRRPESPPAKESKSTTRPSMTFFLSNQRNAKPIVRSEVELPSASNPEALSMEETLNTPISMDKKKDEEPSKGLSDYEFYIKIAELLQHAKPDNVEIMVRAIVESVASYNEEKHAAENVGKAGTVREEAPMPSRGKEKEGNTGEAVQGEGSFAREGVSGTWQAGEQQIPDLQVDPLAFHQNQPVSNPPWAQPNENQFVRPNRRSYGRGRHSRAGSRSSRGSQDHGRAMREQLMNPVEDPWSRF